MLTDHHELNEKLTNADIQKNPPKYLETNWHASK